MSYEVAIVADSITVGGQRLTTFKLKYPRMIHAEFMTHRAFSRNASSTRAIPVEKMIEWVEKDPARPVYWGKNQRGMQAGAELDPATIGLCELTWEAARDSAVARARILLESGVHKQIASRILEPFAHINVIVTASNFANFFKLRCHPAAMPEIQVLAVAMARAYWASEPELIHPRWWHLPFLTLDELAELCDARIDADSGHPDSVQRLRDVESACLKMSVARCARVSYETFEGKAPDREKDFALHDQLLNNGHWSPFEHQAKHHPASPGSGNFGPGWTQYRQTLPTSVHRTFDYESLEQFGERGFVIPS